MSDLREFHSQVSRAVKMGVRGPLRRRNARGDSAKRGNCQRRNERSKSGKNVYEEGGRERGEGTGQSQTADGRTVDGRTAVPHDAAVGVQ